MRQPFVVSIVMIGVGTTGCRAPSDEPPSATAVPVALAPVTRDSVVEELVFAGRLAPLPGGDAVLNAPAPGIVRRITAQLGARVRAGQVVLTLDVPELAAAAQQQAVTAAQSRREAERQQQLLTDGLTSRRQLEEAEAAAHAADAAAAAAAQLLARTSVTSPIDGHVQQIVVQQGMRIDAGDRLAEVIASDRLDLVAAVPAPQLARLHLGQPAWVTSDGDTTAYPGSVAALPPAVDSLTNAGQVLIRLANPAGRLRAGGGATARVALGVRRDVLVVPDSALVIAGDSSAVFVVGADSIAHQKTVSVGVRQAKRVEVRGPLRPGDAVVTTGAAGLQDGMRVVPAKGLAAGPATAAR